MNIIRKRHMAFNAVHGGRLHEGEFQTHVYACACICTYSGGRLLLFMQEGVAFCWATSGARACAPNRDSHWGQ